MIQLPHLLYQYLLHFHRECHHNSSLMIFTIWPSMVTWWTRWPQNLKRQIFQGNKAPIFPRFGELGNPSNPNQPFPTHHFSICLPSIHLAPAGCSTSDLLKGAIAQLGSLSDELVTEAGKLTFDSAPCRLKEKLTIEVILFNIWNPWKLKHAIRVNQDNIAVCQDE